MEAYFNSPINWITEFQQLLHLWKKKKSLKWVLFPSARWNEVVICKWRDVNWSCGKLWSNRHWYILVITHTCLPCNWEYVPLAEWRTMKSNETRQCIALRDFLASPKRTAHWNVYLLFVFAKLFLVTGLYIKYKSLLLLSSSSTTHIFPKINFEVKSVRLRNWRAFTWLTFNHIMCCLLCTDVPRFSASVNCDFIKANSLVSYFISGRNFLWKPVMLYILKCVLREITLALFCELFTILKN